MDGTLGYILTTDGCGLAERTLRFRAEADVRLSSENFLKAASSVQKPASQPPGLIDQRTRRCKSHLFLKSDCSTRISRTSLFSNEQLAAALLMTVEFTYHD